MNETEILKRKIVLKRQAVKLLMAEIETLIRHIVELETQVEKLEDQPQEKAHG